jgi:hypothetical protein
LTLRKAAKRFKKLKIHTDILRKATVTADTGFSNSENNRWLKTENINAYIPDNQFRSRDPRFSEQKIKYGKRQQRQVPAKKQNDILIKRL